MAEPLCRRAAPRWGTPPAQKPLFDYVSSGPGDSGLPCFDGSASPRRRRPSSSGGRRGPAAALGASGLLALLLAAVAYSAWALSDARADLEDLSVRSGMLDAHLATVQVRPAARGLLRVATAARPPGSGRTERRAAPPHLTPPPPPPPPPTAPRRRPAAAAQTRCAGPRGPLRAAGGRLRAATRHPGPPR